MKMRLLTPAEMNRAFDEAIAFRVERDRLGVCTRVTELYEALSEDAKALVALGDHLEKQASPFCDLEPLAGDRDLAAEAIRFDELSLSEGRAR